MWKNKARTLLSAVLCISMMATGTSADGYFASDENGSSTPPAAIDSITVSTEDIRQPEIEWDENAEEITGEAGDFMSGFLDLFGGSALTPNGNLTLVDDILQDESYYVSGDKENVYFLNMVDEADLMALIETGSEEPESEPPEVCDCTEKCAVGNVDTDCPVCLIKMADCTGKEIVTTPEPIPEPAKKDNSMLVLLLILAFAGGGAVYYFKFHKPSTNRSGNSDLDEYPFADEEDSDNLDDVEYETEEDINEK